MSLQEVVELEGHIQSIYLAVYDTKLLLLDGCCRSDVNIVLDYITQTLKRPVTDLKVVFVTHMHPDHAGGALSFKRKTGCQVVTANKTTQWYKGIQGRSAHAIDIALTYYVANRKGKPLKYLWYPRYLTPDITVSDGEQVPGFEDWKVIETPGHTDRDLSLYHAETGLVYTADLIIKLRHKFVAPLPVYIPDLYNASLRKIKSLKPKQVLLAHGGKLKIEPEVFDSLIKNAPKEQVTFRQSAERKLLWLLRRTSR